jgi:hypothetical protein
MRRGTVGLALTALVAATAAGFATQGPDPGLTNAHPCADAPGFTCSTLAVPLDHAGRRSGTLRLAVAVQDGDAPKGTLLFLTGGPGQPGVPYAARIAERLGTVRRATASSSSTSAAPAPARCAAPRCSGRWARRISRSRHVAPSQGAPP